MARELGFDEIADIIKGFNENDLDHRHKRLKRCRKRSMMHRYLMAGLFILKKKLARTLEVEPTQLILVMAAMNSLCF